ncbi:MAG TPA: DNA-formamidopyrimidine glycosylase family protein [Solirubrobacteraceae bacterium]|nr:DNA-formamidopyrimidine glycosylase family protein [Solirubrobacteraceae bacterium]
MPEGDTIAWTAKRIRPALEGRAPDEIFSPRNPTWPQRLAGQAVTHLTTHGKHLFLHFEGGLVLHSHLGMSGYWSVVREPSRSSATWLMLRIGERWVVERHGPTLELLTEGRVRFDQRLSALGPDVLAAEFDSSRFLGRLRADDPTRPLGDALLDQRNVAGIGNIWKAEGCWEAQIDPWRPVAEVSDEEASAVINQVRPRMRLSAENGPRTIAPRIYKRTGQPCPRCGTRVRARGQGDANRTTYWCPGCQR